MINVLKFQINNNYNYSWGLSCKILYKIFDYLDGLMLIYKYKLPSQQTKRGYYLHNKYQCKNPDNLVLEKLKGKNLFILHISIWEGKLDKFREVINYCNSNGIDIWICTYESIKKSIVDDIEEVLNDYEINEWDFTTKSEYTSVKDVSIDIIRDIQLRKLI